MEEKYHDEIIMIDFKAIFKVLWWNKWLIFGITALFIIGGAIFAFTAREEFYSEGKILPELSNSASGDLGGLAGLAALGGIDLNSGANGSDAIRPDLYPDVISSTPFFLNLLNQKFLNKYGDTLLFETFYHEVIEENKEPKEIKLELFKARPNGVIVLNRLTEERIKDLKKRIFAEYDKKSGIISISAKMPEPIIAAQVAYFSMNYLTNYVTDYRTEKLKQEVDFLGQKVASARGEFYKDQARKATYADQFSAPTIRLQSADIRRERLESDYKMSAGVYNELLKKFEESKIRLQKETPVFQILSTPNAPTLKSEPKRIVIVLISSFIGALISLITTLIIKNNYKRILK